MDETKALLGHDQTFEVGPHKVRIKIPTGEWLLGAVGYIDKLPNIMSGKVSLDTIRVIRHIMAPVRIPGRPFVWQRVAWFRKLNVIQQGVFLEKWLESLDIGTIKDVFRRVGQGLESKVK
jgi:hypothetical protein